MDLINGMVNGKWWHLINGFALPKFSSLWCHRTWTCILLIRNKYSTFWFHRNICIHAIITKKAIFLVETLALCKKFDLCWFLWFYPYLFHIFFFNFFHIYVMFTNVNTTTLFLVFTFYYKKANEFIQKVSTIYVQSNVSRQSSGDELHQPCCPLNKIL